MNEQEFISALAQLHGDAHSNWLTIPFEELPIDSLDLFTFSVMLEQNFPVVILDTKFPPKMTLLDLYEAVQ